MGTGELAYNQSMQQEIVDHCQKKYVKKYMPLNKEYTFEQIVKDIEQKIDMGYVIVKDGDAENEIPKNFLSELEK